MAIETKKVLILELNDRQKSGFILEGSQQAGMPVHLDGPGWRRIPPTSHVWVDGKYKAIRHIQGAPSIFVEDQDKAKMVFNAVRDNIKFDGVVKTVVREGRTVTMYDYLAACEYNFHAPDKPGTENIIFREVRAEEAATIDVGDLKYKKKANEIVDELYTETATGFTYDMPRMKMLAHVLGITDQQTPSEILMAIASVAERSPKFFLSTIADKTNAYKQDIEEAIHHGLISFDGPGASFVNSGVVFLKLKEKKDRAAQIDELVRHFLYPEGAIDYRTLRIDLQAVKQKLAEIK